MVLDLCVVCGGTRTTTGGGGGRYGGGLLLADADADEDGGDDQGKTCDTTDGGADDETDVGAVILFAWVVDGGVGFVRPAAGGARAASNWTTMLAGRGRAASFVSGR